uniref:Uncharacterized protein n=1 Tax=Moniliophthora roreri TaxID=221103 RepID=A0A0W0FQ73_MONRR
MKSDDEYVTVKQNLSALHVYLSKSSTQVTPCCSHGFWPLNTPKKRYMSA